MSATSNVVPFSRMSPADYERERTALRETYGDNSQQAGAKRDQALAKLFDRSGWTQEELAKKETKTQQWVAYRVRFGRFLNFTTAVVNPETDAFTLPSNLTERKFREYWERTDKDGGNERARFLAVARLMRDDLALMHKKRPRIGPDIIKKFGDGKWHRLETIVNAIAPDDEEHVTETLRKMGLSKSGTYGVRAERKQNGKTVLYRIFRPDRKISAVELKTKLHPIIVGLKAEGRKSVVTMSVVTVAKLAALLERMVDEWVEGVNSSSNMRPDEFAAVIAGVKDDDND